MTDRWVFLTSTGEEWSPAQVLTAVAAGQALLLTRPVLAAMMEQAKANIAALDRLLAEEESP